MLFNSFILFSNRIYVSIPMPLARHGQAKGFDAAWPERFSPKVMDRKLVVQCKPALAISC